MFYVTDDNRPTASEIATELAETFVCGHRKDVVAELDRLDKKEALAVLARLLDYLTDDYDRSILRRLLTDRL